MPASSNFPLVASIAFLIILTFIKFLREMEFDTGGGNERVIKYTENEVLQRRLYILSKPFAVFFGDQGRFVFSFFITEFIIVISILLVILSSDVSSFLLNAQTTLQRVQSTSLALLFGIWISFPALVIREYESVYKSGIIPTSFGMFASITILQTILIISVFLLFGNELANGGFGVGNIIFVLGFGAGIPLKQHIFVDMLEKEIEKSES